MLFKRHKSHSIKIPNENYKKESELTKEDYCLIDMDRKCTGIEIYSDEYYYNNILYCNYENVQEDC